MASCDQLSTQLNLTLYHIFYASVCGCFLITRLLWGVFNSFFYCSGRAIKHVKESIFTPEAGARRGVPKVLVVLTDGRSQDDVNKVSKEMQMEGK